MNCDTQQPEREFNRPSCLLENSRVQAAIETLIEELEEDCFLYSLRECMVCRQGQERSDAINLHCQLKSVMEILRQINQHLLTLQQSHRHRCHRPLN